MTNPYDLQLMSELIQSWVEFRALHSASPVSPSLSDWQKLQAYEDYFASNPVLRIPKEIAVLRKAFATVSAAPDLLQVSAQPSEVASIKQLIEECLRKCPYEMSESEAKRFLLMKNSAAAWNASLRPAINERTVTITHIDRIHNPTLESEFDGYAKRTSLNPLNMVTFVGGDSRKRAEALLGRGKGNILFHGTSVHGVLGIGKDGFAPLLCNRTPMVWLGYRYGSLGQGVYLSDNFAKCAAWRSWSSFTKDSQRCGPQSGSMS